MHQWMVTLRVQALAKGKQLIVIKVQMSDEAYQRLDADSRRQLVEHEAKKTLVAANQKIWATPTVPLIEATKTWPLISPVPETGSPDHQTFSDLFAWVKKPTSPFSAP
jgi:hypothetical protein